MNSEKFLEVSSKYTVKFLSNANLGETLIDFNDMGIMQAVDNITAVLAVIAILKDNNLQFNKNKIMIYGYSHGAYLSYLCNAFAPSLFSIIIDNSAWLIPEYITSNRRVHYQVGNAQIVVNFEYLARKLLFDIEILSLPFLYNQFENNCTIICFRGVTDCFVKPAKKENFCKSVQLSIFNEISSEKVDGVIFKSTNHGLDADYFNLLDFVFGKYHKLFNKSLSFQLPTVNYITQKHSFQFDYTTGMPIVKVNSH